MTYQTHFTVNTSGHRDMHDITPQVTAAVAESGLRTGTVHTRKIIVTVQGE